jgi:hypothetical protein
VIEAYRMRAAEQARLRDIEQDRSRTISRLRLATFLPAAALLIWTLSAGATPLPLAIAAALFVLFGALVVWHARVEDRAAWFEALRTVNLQAVARIERTWNELPPAVAPPSSVLDHHPYALDLDLFGRASLVQWLGPAATHHGSQALNAWLLHPAPRPEIALRQDAVQQLAAAAEWRERLFALGLRASAVREAELTRFLAWAEGPQLFGRHGPLLRVVVRILTVSIGVFAILYFAGAIETPVWLALVTIGLILSFATALQVHGSFDAAGAGQEPLSRYAALFAHAVAAPAAATRLQQIHARLGADGTSAPRCMAKLNRLLGFADLRRGAGIFHFPVQALTLWDFHLAFALDDWRAQVGGRVRDWMLALGDLDGLAVLARVRADNPGWAMPELSEVPIVAGTAIGHPLLRDDRAVRNDVEVGPAGTVLLVTGSNMSGKSTLLRSIGLNIVLAQAGGASCAAAFRLPPSDLQTSIRVQDSLELGLSYFMAALARLKGVVDAAEHERPGRVLVYLLDEILQGTNTAERAIAVRAIARHLLEAGAIGVMTTHDLSLAESEPLATTARLVHFTETVDESGRMTFDYTLRPGLATSRNALRLMNLIGLEL